MYPWVMSGTWGAARSGTSRGAARSGGTGGVDACRVVFAARACGLPVVRRRLQDWLHDLDWPVEPAQDIVLAVNEAVTNAVEHAYSGVDPDAVGAGAAAPIDVRAVVERSADLPVRPRLRSHAPTTTAVRAGDRVRIRVRDAGRWRPDAHDRSDRTRVRGRGLSLMEALTSSLTVTTGPAGTEVEMLSEAGPTR